MPPPGLRNALPRCRSLCCNEGGMPLAASRSAASRIRGTPSATAAASASSSRRGSDSGSTREASTIDSTQPTTTSGSSGKVGTPVASTVSARPASTSCTAPNPCTTSTQSGTGGTSSSCHIGSPRSAVASQPRSRSTASGVATASGTSASTTSTSAASNACDGAFSFTHTRPASVSTRATTDQKRTRSRTTGAVVRTPTAASAGASQPSRAASHSSLSQRAGRSASGTAVPEPRDRLGVALHPVADDVVVAHVGEVAVVAELLAGVDVADVHLDAGHPAGRERVAQGDRGVGVARGVDDEAGDAGTALLHPVDEGALVVALPEVEQQTGSPGGLEAERLDVGEGRAAVDLRLALAEEVEVGAVEHQHRAVVHDPEYAGRVSAAQAAFRRRALGSGAVVVRLVGRARGVGGLDPARGQRLARRCGPAAPEVPRQPVVGLGRRARRRARDAGRHLGGQP